MTPTTNQTISDEFLALLALLAVIKDPDTHKKRLDELIAQEAAAKEQIAALNEMAGETRRLNSAAQATTIVLNNRKTALDAREAEIAESAKNHDLAVAAHKSDVHQASQKLSQREAELTRREAALQSRETRVKEMEAETKAALDQAETLKTKMQRQAAAVQVALQ